MRINNYILITIFSITLCSISLEQGYTGQFFPFTFSQTDSNNSSGESPSLFYFFDLRDRETFIQLTYPDSLQSGFTGTAHVQIFDVSNNCTENNFFDDYTVNDTHVYNMRDIQTNDGNPSGVVLPDGAYGIVAVVLFGFSGQINETGTPFGNMRIIDNTGYEYRTNAQNPVTTFGFGGITSSNFYSFNFNQEEGVIFSDVIGITFDSVSSDFGLEFEVNPPSIFTTFDIDIVNNNEVLFSCRDVIFACINQESILQEPLLEFAGNASVADFEYGINNAIPHSKGGELLCPGNVAGEGTVILRPEAMPDSDQGVNGFVGYVGLNNGNGRGSLDSFWIFNNIGPSS